MKTRLFLNTSRTRQKRRTIAALVALTLLLIYPLSAQTSDSETAKLKQQIEQLKQENQQLRQALLESPAAATTATPVAARNETAASAQTTSQDQGLTHWLTISSGKRHNSNCRWYRNSRGRPCRADEGIPCKICGG